MKRAVIAVWAVTLGTLMSTAAFAAGNITPSAGIPPDVAAKFAKNMARNRLSVLTGSDLTTLSDGTVINNVPGAGATGARNCITNIGAQQQPGFGSGLRFGPTGAGQDNTIIIRGDIINVCQ
jgi:hypothetical protein